MRSSSLQVASPSWEELGKLGNLLCISRKKAEGQKLDGLGELKSFRLNDLRTWNTYLCPPIQ